MAFTAEEAYLEELWRDNETEEDHLSMRQSQVRCAGASPCEGFVWKFIYKVAACELHGTAGDRLARPRGEGTWLTQSHPIVAMPGPLVTQPWTARAKAPFYPCTQHAPTQVLSPGAVHSAPRTCPPCPTPPTRHLSPSHPPAIHR